jgi:CheY-like chemotaxis protein
MTGQTHRDPLGVRAALPLMILAALACSARAEEDIATKSERLFREVVDLRAQGRRTEAQAKLRELMALEPRKELVARLVEEAGVKTMAQMVADPRMGNEPNRLWELYRKYYIGKRLDKERLTKLAARVVDPGISEDERTLMYREFTELGHYAVPYLAPYLKDVHHEDFRTHARIVLARMGPVAILPLIELLGHKDELMRANAIMTIMDITPPDERAIPALKTRLEDPKETPTVKRHAEQALLLITGLKPERLRSAATYCYLSANRYYLGMAGSASEAEEVDGYMWHLNDAGDLIPLLHPLWAWELQMAEDLVLKGMKLEPDQADFYPLAACIYAAQYQQVKELVEIVGEQPAQHMFSEEEKQIVLEWDKKMASCRNLAAACGKDYVNAALLKVLRDIRKYPENARLGETGVFLCRTLQELDPRGQLLAAPAAAVTAALPPAPSVTPVVPLPVVTVAAPLVAAPVVQAPVLPVVTGARVAPIPGEGDQVPPGHSCALVHALDCVDQEVQYAAGLALAAINKFPESWVGQDKVARILARGVSEDKPPQVLVIEESHNIRNQMRLALEKLNFGVTDAVNGRDGLIKARSYPPKDVILVADTLRVDLNAEQVLEELKADVRSRYIPPAILHDRANRAGIQARFGTEMALVEREMEGEDLRQGIQKVLDRRPAEAPPKRRAHEIAVACATALSRLEPAATNLALNDAVPNCYGALINRRDEVRIPAAAFLGQVRGGDMRDKVAERLAEVFLKEENAVEMRLAAVKALGRVKPEAYTEEYIKAQTDPKLAGEKEMILQEWAAINFGRATRTNDKLIELLSAKRVDRDKKEK